MGATFGMRHGQGILVGLRERVFGFMLTTVDNDGTVAYYVLVVSYMMVAYMDWSVGLLERESGKSLL
jgi:hypothetical protein